MNMPDYHGLLVIPAGYHIREMLRSEGYPDTLAVELDALPPAVLQTMIRDSIEDCLNLSHLQAEREVEGAELANLAELRDRSLPLLEGLLRG